MTNSIDKWEFSHSKASEAVWTPGLREIFEYRDLGWKDSSKGDYVAHIVKANGEKMADEVQGWHIHDCTFQFAMVLNGWAEFEYEGQGIRRIENTQVEIADFALVTVRANKILTRHHAMIYAFGSRVVLPSKNFRVKITGRLGIFGGQVDED